MKKVLIFSSLFIALLAYLFDIEETQRKSSSYSDQTSLANEIFSASETGDIDKVKSILKSGFDPNYTNDEGVTAIELSLIHKHLDVFTELLEHGADANTTISGTDFPLIFFGVVAEHKNFLEQLTANGADLNADFGIYGTPLLKALRVRQYDIALYLLQNGAWPNNDIQRKEAIEFLCADTSALDKQSLIDRNRVSQKLAVQSCIE